MIDLRKTPESRAFGAEIIFNSCCKFGARSGNHLSQANVEMIDAKVHFYERP